ncbi:efflux transporter outer membrane subunit [Achromobacter sp. GG226]|uniref:efflux transporter outer membrane subunit n=1 Tax=Verticiella alkaliphila TaxID=2779529 RepID=UPI001C0D79FD|nr:efflux transporter outer membrane subunit [Verticiella sp. GG226]MBU4612352.1 efflux transporter outer membrane subunit [Verticiella sp. GG226]
MLKTFVCARRVAGIAALVTLAACGTPQHRDAPAVPETYVGAPVAQPVDEAVLARWWTAFEDPVLAELVQTAQVRNRDVGQAMVAVAKARAQLRGVRAQRYPTLDLGGEAGRQFTRSERLRLQGPLAVDLADLGDSGSTRIDTWNSAVQAGWELDLFGATRARAEAGERLLAASEAQVGAARLAVAANVGNAYVEIRALQARRAMLEDAVAIARELERIGQLRFEIGEVTRLDVEAQAAERASAQADLAELDIALAEARFALDTLMAAPPGWSAQRLAEPADVPVVTRAIPPGQPTTLLARRPDVLAEFAQLEAAEYQALGARRDLFPRITLSAALGGQGLAVGGLLSSVSSFAQVGAMFAWPLLDGGRRQSAIDDAQADVDAAYLSLAQTLAEALQDVETALAQIAGRQQQATARGEALARAARAHELARLSYEIGEVGLAEVLDAQRAWLQAREGLLQTQRALAGAQVALFTALGGGWETDPAAPPGPATSHASHPRVRAGAQAM